MEDRPRSQKSKVNWKKKTNAKKTGRPSNTSKESFQRVKHKNKNNNY
jgi:hypothetical protein